VLGSFLELHVVLKKVPEQLNSVPPPLAVRGLTRRREKFQAAGGAAAASSPLHFPAGD